MRYYGEFLSHRLILFLLVVILLNGVLFFSSAGGAAAWLAIVAGMVLYGIIEYIVHRYILHQFPHWMPKAYQGHVAHHQHPTDAQHLFGPVRYDLIGYILFFSVLWVFTRNIHWTSAVVLGTSVFQLYYQWKHFVAHRPIVPWTPWGKRMKKWHLLHHYQDPKHWYGVSHPFMDFLFGTGRGKQPKQTFPFRRNLFLAADIGADMKPEGKQR
jgi:4-hydroxysphinganine ceramide fatty acyl 2-hydroxylase